MRSVWYGCSLHVLPLVSASAVRRFCQIRERHRDPPDVVDERGAPERATPVFVEPSAAAAALASSRDAGRVTGQVRRDRDRRSRRSPPARGRSLRPRGSGAAPARARAPRPTRTSRGRARGSPAASSARQAATAGSKACPARSLHDRDREVLAAQQALELGVPSDVHDPDRERDLLRLARPSQPLPSQRSVRRTKSSCTGVGSPSRPASISATSQTAARWGSRSLLAFGSRRANWSARTGAARPGSGRARRSPPSSRAASRTSPGRARSVSRRTSPRTSASVVQPEYISRHAKYVCDAVARSTSSRSASRIAISVLWSPCSNGKPMARSVPRHSAAAASAARMGVEASSATTRQ